MEPAKTMIITGLTAALLTLPASGAMAEPVCMDADEMEAALVDWYGASPVPEARTASSDLWVSASGGIWAIVDYARPGTACVVAQGDGWPGSSDGVTAVLQQAVPGPVGPQAAAGS